MRAHTLCGFLCCAALLVLAPTAGAANSVYWSNSGGAGLGRVALNGGEGFVLNPAPIPAEEPFGSAIDAQAGKVFWGDFHSNTIKYANLDGSGSAVLPTGAASVDAPNAPVVDIADGRIYWANANDDTISWANLDGSGGGGRVPLSANFSEEPDSVAVDSANDRIYWSNFEGGSSEGSIGWASLGVPDAALLPLPPGLVVEPGGLAISPSPRSQIYWTNEGNSEGIFSAWEEGESAARIDTGGAPLAHPSSPSLFEAPSLQGAGLPRLGMQVTRGVSLGATLTCNSLNWAADSPESHLYRAPQTLSTSWTFEGVTLNGATGETVIAAQPGTYACQATASNGAGSTTVTTATFEVRPSRGPSTPSSSPRVRLTKIKHDLRDGTVTIVATVTGPGTLTLRGGKIVGRSVIVTGAGVEKLKVAAQGGPLRILRRTGKLKIEVLIGFAAASGARTSSEHLITLKRKTRR